MPSQFPRRRALWLTLLASLFSTQCNRSVDPTAALPPPPVFNVAPLTPGPRSQLQSLTAAFQAKPNEGAANLNLAKALIAYEAFVAAEGYLRRAVVLDPRNFESRYMLGYVHSTTGDHEAALADFDAALKLQPSSLPARIRRANTLRRLARNAEAEKAYREILKEHSALPQARFGLGNVLLASGKYQDSISVLEDLCTEYPRFGAAHFTLAEAQRHAGNREKADAQLADFKSSPNWEPPLDDPSVQSIVDLNRSHQGLYNRALKAGAAGNWKQAATLLEEAVSEDPFFLVGHVNLVTCYAHLGDSQKADEHYRRALALSPASSELQNTQGLVDKVAGRKKEARAHFQQALRTDPDHYSSWENLGQLDYEAGDLPAALHDYQQSALIAPESSRSWIMMGTIQLKQDRRDLARESFLHVVRPGAEAEPAARSVMNAYREANDRDGWLVFARAAIARARELGMSSLQSQLEMMTH